MLKKGFDGTSVRDIAGHASVNRAMISYYFGSKEKLLIALIEHRAGYTRGILEELAKDENITPFEKMDRLVDMYVDKISQQFKISLHRYHPPSYDAVGRDQGDDGGY